MANIIKDFVVEESTTTGTGSLTLSGALNNMRRFSDVCSTGDTVRYIIKGVDSGGVPTGEWEVVEGVYSAANTLTRVTVIASSNSDALVNFSSGPKQVYIGPDAARLSWMREKLTAARTYYVRTDGSDSNNGLANTSGGAFLTVQKAIDVIYATLDLGGKDVTVQVADGTYTGAVLADGPFIGKGSVTINGNNSTPTNVVFSTTSSSCVTAQNGAFISCTNFKVTTTTSGFGLLASKKGHVNFSGIDFGTCATHQIRSDDFGSVTATGNYTISGGAATHFNSVSGAIRIQSRTVTLSNTPAFSTAFCQTLISGLATVNGNTYSGTGATGVRYDITLNGVVYTAGGGANYFPGNAAGTTATGGQYI